AHPTSGSYLDGVTSMRTSACTFFSVAFVVATAVPGVAGDEKPLASSSKPVSEWIETLKSSQDDNLVDEARQALGPGGPYAKTAIPLLIDALDEERSFGRSLVAATLADYGPPVVPILVRALASSKARVKAAAAEALGAVRPRSKEAVPALIGALKDPNRGVRVAVAKSLGRIRQPFDKTALALAAALQDTDLLVRATAVRSLGKLGRGAEPAVPGVVAALKEKDARLRGDAVGALARIGPAAKGAVP